MQAAAGLYSKIARSHMYWGRKPLVGLLQVFEGVDGGLVLDPFCGAGTPALAALISGARVIAGDLNPMGIFLTRVLARPLSIPLLATAFEEVKSTLEESTASSYGMRCPTCGGPGVANFVVWSGDPENGRPVAAKVQCRSCKNAKVLPLDLQEEKRQKRQAGALPSQPYPDTPIHAVSRQSPVPSHDRLFTSRNLAHLADLLAAINSVKSVPCREALQYVFTASLYSCSQMQMYSEKDPSSSRGWTALRYYIPPKRKETNVLHAFSRRFKSFLSCKELLNDAMPAVRVTDRDSLFDKGSAELLLHQLGWRDCLERFGGRASYIFLDPPYNADIDYFGFSEFWGSWLGMRFPFEEEWHARRSKGTITEELLMRVSRSTSKDCRVVLALDPKNRKGWETASAIEASGYRVASTGFFLYDQTNKAEKSRNLLRRRDLYYVLERARVLRSSVPAKLREQAEAMSNAPVYPYVRALEVLVPDTGLSSTQLKAHAFSDIVPARLRHLWQNLSTDLDEARRDPNWNRRTYHSFCLAHTALLLKHDGWSLQRTRGGEVESGEFGLPQPVAGGNPAGKAIAEFASADRQHSFLVYFAHQDEALLAKAARRIAKDDEDRFKRIAVLITRSHAEMGELRIVSKAGQWQRGFFVCMEELLARCTDTSPEEAGRISLPLPKSPIKMARSRDSRSGIGAFPAIVLENVRVGGKDSPYRKLQFEAAQMTGIVPGQFIMMDTCPRAKRVGPLVVPWSEFKTAFRDAPTTYLKRPFGIHRAFYPGFPDKYLMHLDLPRHIATVMHTVVPDRFDIFYKVLPHGKGTIEMQQLGRGIEVEMLAPLGSRFDLRALVNEGVEEVHVVGGGVGMAPLIFLVQALRYFGIPVKAFIGIESYSNLRYRLDETYEAAGKDVDIYVDDLKEAGVECENIYVSYDKDSELQDIVPPQNHAKGFVTDLYARYLANHDNRQGRVAFACGPMPMMKKLYEHTQATNIELHVLMEKRMACGIGVCLSCVCRTKKNGHSGYSRVCKDGPIFNANEIEWNEDNNK